MPANLTPQYHEAEEQFRQAKTIEEKIAALELMYREIPKHKGTSRMQADLKRRLSELRNTEPKQQGKKSGVSYHIDSQGFQQVVVIGPANTGKSKFISVLTGAELKVADYPFTTRVPQPAMMKYEDIRIQLVDTPAVSPDHYDTWMPGIVRAGDAAILLIDMSNEDTIEQIQFIEQFLKEQNVYLVGDRETPDFPITADVQPTIMVGNKCDSPEAEIMREFILEAYQKRFTLFEASATTGQNLDIVRKQIFEALAIVRVYPKPPGKKPDLSVEPILLKKGSTVWDLADHIHHDIAQKLKSGRIWNSSRYTDGQKIPTDYELEDRNIIELEVG